LLAGREGRRVLSLWSVGLLNPIRGARRIEIAATIYSQDW
jgi:hypothetical protein